MKKRTETIERAIDELKRAINESEPVVYDIPKIEIGTPSVKGRGNIQPGKTAVLCLVLYRMEHGGRKIQEIYDAPAGRTMQYKGKQVRLLRENPSNGKLETYVPYGKEIGIPANKLSQCRQCLPAQHLLRLRGGLMEKIAIWAIVVATGIGGFLLIVIMGELNKPGA